MNRNLLFLSVFALVCAAGCSSLPSTRSAGGQSDSVAVRKSSNQRILVGFADRSIGRVAMADPSLPYRTRGGLYITSEYSDRIVTELSRDYQLKKVTDWPMTTLGIHCVMFEIGDGQSVANVIDALSKDRRVTIAQRVGKFQVLAGSSS